MEPVAPRGWLLAVLAAAVCPACLILDPTDFPEKVNAVPRIGETNPSVNGCPRVDRTSLEAFVLTAPVTDDDLEDVLDARQFVDGNLGSEDPLIEPSAQGDGTERVITASFDPGEDFDHRGFFVVEIHVVDDASGWIGSSANVEEGVGRDSETWIVFAHDGDGFDDIADCPEPQ